MRYPVLFAALVGGGMSGLAGPAAAQFYPGVGYGGWGGTNGSAALLGSDYRQASLMQAKTQSMVAGQQRTMAQNEMVQSGIRNTLSSQAQAQNNAILSQQQANQDWWFQHQVQQTAQRSSMEYASGASPISMGFGPSGGPPPANMDIIKWPTLLQEPCFASERAQIEAPYRHTTPKQGNLSPAEERKNAMADYRNMASAVDDMKAVLEWRLTQGAITADYNSAKEFLNVMSKEITDRVLEIATPEQKKAFLDKMSQEAGDPAR